MSNIDVSKLRWRYLRESDTKYFNPSRNTCLKDYLEHIFPDHAWIYDACMTKDIVQSRKHDSDVRRYRPDGRCEELNLIVEFDGLAHYQDQRVVISDINRDTWFESLGYTVVRIPYWIQLSRSVIYNLFHVDISEAMCTLPYSFYNPDTCDPCIEISPGSMSEAGRDRFVREFNLFDDSIKKQIMQDINECIKHLPTNIPSKYVLPDDVESRLIL